MRDVYITMPITGVFERLLLAAVVPDDLTEAFQRCRWTIETEPTRWRNHAECVAEQQIETERPTQRAWPSSTTTGGHFAWLGMPRQGTKRGWSMIADHLTREEAFVFRDHVIRPVSVQPMPEDDD